jgi:hypothetical protein
MNTNLKAKEIRVTNLKTSADNNVSDIRSGDSGIISSTNISIPNVNSPEVYLNEVNITSNATVKGVATVKGSFIVDGEITSAN